MADFDLFVQISANITDIAAKTTLAEANFCTLNADVLKLADATVAASDSGERLSCPN